MQIQKTIVQLPLASITIGRYQTRKQNVGKDIEELAESIRVQGLIQPISVCPSPDEPDRYEVLAGQRRFLAHQLLGLQTIDAIIHPTPSSDLEGKVLSLTENFLSEDPTAADYVDICTELYYKYGDLKEVSRRTGLPYDKVRLYVKFDRLVDPMKELVKHAGVDLKVALKAQDAAFAGGGGEEKAVELAKQMMKLPNTQREKAVRAVEENPSVTVVEAVLIAKAPITEVKLSLTLDTRISDSLNKYARKEGTDPADAALSLVIQGLSESGYMSEEDL